jgi:beta-lactamase superfamily II metal-dependent hydrolase
MNNRSIVIKMEFGSRSILFTGDAETEIENRMVIRYGDFLKSDILKAGHHGSITSSSGLFLDVVQPSMAIISVGAKNKFQHPSPEILLRYESDKITYFRTDVEGAIILESDGKRWSKIDWR